MHDATIAFKNKVYFNAHSSAFTKLNRLWNQSSRPKSSEAIVNELGCAVNRPVVTRWNAVNDCINAILRIDPKKLSNLMEMLELPQLSPIDLCFLHEYVRVLGPIAKALDCLQAECHFALLLPIIHSTNQDLLELQKEKLKFC